MEVQRLISCLKVDSVEETTFYQKFSALRKELGIPQSYEDFRPGDQIQALSIVGEEPGKLEDVLRLGNKVNSLRAVARSVRSVSSGIRPYESFFSLLGRPFLPPTRRAQSSFGGRFLILAAHLGTTLRILRRLVS